MLVLNTTYELMVSGDCFGRKSWEINCNWMNQHFISVTVICSSTCSGETHFVMCLCGFMSVSLWVCLCACMPASVLGLRCFARRDCMVLCFQVCSTASPEHFWLSLYRLRRRVPQRHPPLNPANSLEGPQISGHCQGTGVTGQKEPEFIKKSKFSRLLQLLACLGVTSAWLRRRVLRDPSGVLRLAAPTDLGALSVEAACRVGCSTWADVLWCRKGTLVIGCMKKIRDPWNSIAAGKFKVFRIELESKGAT